MQERGWKQEKFILSTFEAIRNDRGDFKKIISANQEAGINVVEIVFKNRALVSRILEVCEELGMATIIQDPAFGGIGERIVTTDDKTVEEVLAHYAPYRHIYGYYLWDEPIEEAFDHCRDTKERFQRLSPRTFLHFCAFPSYGVYTWDSFAYNWEENTYTKYIDGFLRTIDPPVVTLDYYPFRSSSMELVNSDLWRDMGYLSKRARQLEKPFWFYFQGVDMETGVCSIAVPKITAQMFAAIAYNAKGLSWFVTADVLTDLDGEKKANFEELKKANFEALHLGDFFFDKQLERIYHTPYDEKLDTIYYQGNIRDSALIKVAPDHCIVSEFSKKDDDKRYLLIVNKQHDKSADGVLELKENMQVAFFDKTDAVLGPFEEKKRVCVWLDAGDALAIVLKKAGGDLR